MRIVHVVGARPNFMKMAPVMAALSERDGISQKLVHTGQHYDPNMSRLFFDELELPEPDLNLQVGSGTHGAQTAQIMIRFEEIMLADRPDLVLVYGDINSTVAAALVCAKLLIPVGHVEAGLRSLDRTMPEEINRLLTDQIADFLFTPSADADRNLLQEGISRDRIHLVGNAMIDTLVRLLPRAMERWEQKTFEPWHNRPYVLVTLHRPSSVDEPDMLGKLMSALHEISQEIPVIFPVHPRTRQRLSNYSRIPTFQQSSNSQPSPQSSNPAIKQSSNSPPSPQITDSTLSDSTFSPPLSLNPSSHSTLDVGCSMFDVQSPAPPLSLIPPLGYLDFLALQRHATLVITDSGGIQEETTYLGVPCLTVRQNTERPITLTLGTNILVGHDTARLTAEAHRIIQGSAKQGSIPPLWDGHTGHRIADIICS